MAAKTGQKRGKKSVAVLLERKGSEPAVHIDELDLEDSGRPVPTDGIEGPVATNPETIEPDPEVSPAESETTEPESAPTEAQDETPWVPQIGDRVDDPSLGEDEYQRGVVFEVRGDDDIDVLWDDCEDPNPYPVKQLRLIWRPRVGDRIREKEEPGQLAKGKEGIVRDVDSSLTKHPAYVQVQFDEDGPILTSLSIVHLELIEAASVTASTDEQPETPWVPEIGDCVRLAEGFEPGQLGTVRAVDLEKRTFDQKLEDGELLTGCPFEYHALVWRPAIGDRVRKAHAEFEGLIVSIDEQDDESGAGSITVVWDGDIRKMDGFNSYELELVWRPEIGMRVQLLPEKEIEGAIVGVVDAEIVLVVWDDDRMDDMSEEECSSPVDTARLVPILPASVMASSEFPDASAEKTDTTSLSLIPSRWTASESTVNKTLHIAISNERLAELAQASSEAYRELEAAKDYKKTVNKELSAKVAKAEEHCSKIADAIRDKVEQRPVRCRWYFDYTNCWAELRRDDTGEVVEQRRMSTDEVQLKLSMDDDRHPDDREGMPDDEAEAEPRCTDRLLCNGCGWKWQVDAFYTSVPALHCPGCDGTSISLDFQTGQVHIKVGDRVQMDDPDHDLHLFEGEVISVDDRLVKVNWDHNPPTEVWMNQLSVLLDETDEVNVLHAQAKDLVGITSEEDIADQDYELDAMDDDDDESVRACRICGCTDDNCEQCVEKTGKPCHWVTEDICSACYPDLPDGKLEDVKDEDAVRAATSMFHQSQLRWERAAATGLTNQQVREAILHEFGDGSGCTLETVKGAFIQHGGSKSPSIKIYILSHPENARIIKGKALIDLVRTVYNIGQPSQNDTAVEPIATEDSVGEASAA